MRVISGDKKGIPIKAVAGQSTRPTTDKVKESIFNMIGPYFQGGTALDLYGGAGGLGIEALSRGVDTAVFVDREYKAIQTIKANLKSCKLESKAEVYKNDAKRALQALVKRERTFTYIFLDPPYARERLADELTFISDHQLLENEGQVVVEHGIKTVLKHQYGRLSLVRTERYGDTVISIYVMSN
ncbi:16S rRNA (guanine(966)-N(2))-methyltransferase RsmD [Alteribacter populi]|uniref:16S rRNA (guanine(966)-N(2))-methyltransferase RsmD n=1 Tax=Alteribacter populi TaxID=2011011 RepID=UPI000BBB1900|nr:16S rRNA (guanine(966)-N(2))-methyltransferase RsmD [Alteribacter populi]